MRYAVLKGDMVVPGASRKAGTGAARGAQDPLHGPYLSMGLLCDPRYCLSAVSERMVLRREIEFATNSINATCT
eukprot:3140584-Rhodomonas_salina.1